MVRRTRLLSRLRIPDESDFRSAVRHRLVTVRIGLLLGLAVALCFVTGLISHFLQHPQPWFFWPTRPAWLYSLTQGVHVTAGIAAIPLLLAKLWSVYPKLFARPILGSPLRMIERGSIFVLVSSVVFELLTGLFNARQNYPWNFYFPPVHYAVAWIAFGSVVLHVAVKLPVIRRALGEDSVRSDDQGIARRRFLRGTWAATGVAVLATVGSSIPWLRPVSVLGTRSANQEQGLPVNKTAVAAGVSAPGPDWALTVVVDGRRKSLSLQDLLTMPQYTARLPISCVEGWTAFGTWSGVRLSEVVAAVGASSRPVRVISRERPGLYSASVVSASLLADSETLLALRLDGAELSIDHGFPCRLIAPNRPGVLQTKWVDQVIVL